MPEGPMDPELDAALRDRLTRLIAAAPTDGAVSEAPSRPVPTARPRLVARTPLGLSGATLAVVAVVVGAMALSRGTTAGGPVTAVATDGDFRLTLSVPHSRYPAGQAITGVDAVLEYTGSAPSVLIGHASQVIGFAIASADGRHKTEPAWAQSCGQSELSGSAPASAAFSKSGGYWPEESDYPWLKAYFDNQSLVLDPGQWTITAVAEFSDGTCGGRSHEIRAAATIDVVAGAVATTPASNGPGFVDGKPIMTVSQVLAARAAGGLLEATVAVGGWWSNAQIGHSCAAPSGNPGELELYCSDGEFGITELDEPIEVVDAQGYVTPPSGPHLTPWFDSHIPGVDELFLLPIINGQRYPPVPIVVVGHFDDPLAAQCRPEERKLCQDRLVVDRIVSFDAGSVATPAPTPTPTPFPSPAPSPLFDASRCDGDVPYSFVGWTTTDALNIEFERPGHVYAMVTRDVVQLTKGWQEDGNGSGHKFQIWGQHVCLAEEDPHNPGPASMMEFSSVMGTQYVLWDDGRRTPGTSPIYANSK